MRSNRQLVPNRFTALPKYQQWLILVLFSLVFLVVIEAAVWGASLALYKTTGKHPFVSVWMIENFHPIWHAGVHERFARRSSFDPYQMSVFLPYLPYDLASSSAWATDRHGLALHSMDDRERDLAQPGERYRIFVLGGSSVMGSGSPATLGAFIAGALERGRPGEFEVITAGYSGYVSAQELATFTHRLVHFHPDMIITFDGVNDAYYGMILRNYSPNATYYGNELKAKFQNFAMEGPNAISLDGGALLEFLQRFYTVKLAVRILERLGVDMPDHVSVRMRFVHEEIYDLENLKFREEAVDVYLENLTSIAGASRERGVATIHVLQPTLATELVERGERASERERALMTAEVVSLRSVDPEALISALAEFMLAAGERFLERATQNGDHSKNVWLDYSDFFSDVDDLSDVYIDFVHYKDAWMKALGEALAQDILKVAEGERSSVQ